MIVSDVGKHTHLGKIINFAVDELNKVAALPSSHQVNEVIEMSANQGYGQLDKMDLRSTNSDCKENSSCPASSNTSYEAKPAVRFQGQ